MTLIFLWRPAVASLENSLSLKMSSQESSKTSRQVSSCEMKSNPENFVTKNVQVTLYRAEFGLLMLIEIVNRFKFWIKSVSH